LSKVRLFLAFYFWFNFIFIAFLCGCSPTYPKEKLIESVHKLFRKELKVEVQTKLVGKTLYVSFEIENLVSKNFDLPKEVIEKLEDAMISISRISLSTDAEIDFTVIQAEDPKWGVQTNIIRRMKDLRGLMYWGISKQDFDERLVLETEKIVKSDTYQWHDITLPEYMARIVASRISLGSRANPFLSVLLGIEKMSAQIQPESKELIFTVEGASDIPFSSTSSVSMELLRDTIQEQMSQVEKKYPVLDQRIQTSPLRDPDWVTKVIVNNSDGKTLFEIPREEWLTIQNNKKQEPKRRKK